MRIGIIGAGPAGVALANLLAGSENVILINPEEPYDRPPLSKELFTEPYEQLEVGENVQFTQGTVQAVQQGDGFLLSVDVLGGKLRTFEADILVLATGTRPNHYLKQAHTLATLADARALATQAREGGRLHIVGGGWIGCEVASVARTEGIEVDLWEAQPSLLTRSFGLWPSSPWPAMLTQAGVGLHLGQQYPDGALADGVCLLEATGTTPETGLARALGCSLSPRGGILTDTGMRAHTEPRDKPTPHTGAIYAIGDCADIALGGGRIYYGGHWRKALADAQRCASAILAEPAPRVIEAPEVFSTQFGHAIALVGHVPHDLNATGVRIEESEGMWQWYQGEKLLAQLSFNQPRMVGKARKALRTPITELIEDA